ncbi:unnamed protein product [Lepeophtheirus salmonis]|uniref:ATP-dependent DNA helicase n=1 Tax=Lepeophtheirus salmonis TaxID=72036 RepID=A0A7R8CE46_LEPSM|nr:unnamed protein product [Lepeophtheirus salmonis]CAF2792259.1 unnamed protein product [Lepeophtheirus salmonis]
MTEDVLHEALSCIPKRNMSFTNEMYNNVLIQIEDMSTTMCGQYFFKDECTMAHNTMLEVFDCTLLDIRENNSLMGGLALVLLGDFRQTLPVIPRGTPADELKACLQDSHLWWRIHQILLHTTCVLNFSDIFKQQSFQSQIFSTQSNLERGSTNHVAADSGCTKIYNGNRFVVKRLLEYV